MSMRNKGLGIGWSHSRIISSGGPFELSLVRSVYISMAAPHIWHENKGLKIFPEPLHNIG